MREIRLAQKISNWNVEKETMWNPEAQGSTGEPPLPEQNLENACGFNTVAVAIKFFNPFVPGCHDRFWFS